MLGITTSQAFVRAKIEVLAKDKDKIKKSLPQANSDLILYCIFNPQQVKITYDLEYKIDPNTGLPKKGPLDPKIDYKGPKGKVITVPLLFDTTLDRKINEQKTYDRYADVKANFIDTLFFMMEPLVQDSDTQPPRPPRVNFTWGDMTKYMKSGVEPYVITKAEVTYQQFDKGGSVLKAAATVTMQRAFAVQLPKQNPTTVSQARRVWLVEAGQTLHWIAYREYGDPAMWRAIAHLNNLSDPRNLTPGQLLKLPEAD